MHVIVIVQGCDTKHDLAMRAHGPGPGSGAWVIHWGDRGGLGGVCCVGAKDICAASSRMAANVSSERTGSGSAKMGGTAVVGLVALADGVAPAVA